MAYRRLFELGVELICRNGLHGGKGRIVQGLGGPCLKGEQKQGSCVDELHGRQGSPLFLNECGEED